MPERDLQSELDSLYAQTLALELVLFALLSRMLPTSHVGQIVVPSLNEAADRAADCAVIMGDRASPEHSGRALEIVEELRKAIVGAGPKHRRGS